MLLHISIILSPCLCRISYYECTIICSSIYLGKGIWVIFSLRILWIKLIWTFVYKFFCCCVFPHWFLHKFIYAWDTSRSIRGDQLYCSGCFSLFSLFLKIAWCYPLGIGDVAVWNLFGSYCVGYPGHMGAAKYFWWLFYFFFTHLSPLWHGW